MLSVSGIKRNTCEQIHGKCSGTDDLPDFGGAHDVTRDERSVT